MARVIARPTGDLRQPVVTHVRDHGSVHPLAWWAWALGAAVAASLTVNPLILALIAFSIVIVVLNRRGDAPWAKALRFYIVLALVIIGIRVTFMILLSGHDNGQVLFRLPQVQLPAWAAGINLGGPVTVDGLLYTLYAALSIAVMIFCLGGANALANPRRALRSMPGALYEVSVAVVIALSTAPQLIEATLRIRRAKRLRGGHSNGWHAVKGVLVPVFEDAIERSMQLAASMESRGFAATRNAARVPRAATWTLLGSLVALANGCFLLLMWPAERWEPEALLALGLALGWLGVRWSSRSLQVTRYRPDPWRLTDVLVVACGVAACATMIWLSEVDELAAMPLTSPPMWPPLPWQALLITALLLAPGFFTPPPTKDAQ